MSFDDYFLIIKDLLKQICNIDINADDYDGFIVKKLAQSNTIAKDITSHQSHIAITGEQMGLFPFIHPMRRIGANNSTLKNFFVLKAPINIYKKNCDYLGKGYIDFANQEIRREEFCIYPRKDGEQVQLSMRANGRGDSENFIKFREIIRPKSYLIILKRVNQVYYDAFAIKENDMVQGQDITRSSFITIKRLTDHSTFVTSKNFVESSTDEYIIESLSFQQYKKGQNILFYGVAGVGKSYNINKITGEDETFIERIVFHPDYLNTDFIGQILPKVNDDGKIDYQFKAGSFTKILKKAINDPSHHYYLVIEEINRGNAPAIFGEVFQLLDRKADGSSTYRISNDLMAKEIFSDPNKTIFIPNNLTILATMNTADQNVFTLDTAFQRRWTMRMIENNIKNCDYKNVPVLDTGVSWQQFNTVINEHILEVNKDTLTSEDKRLGAFFIRADELKLPTDLTNGIPFAEKVIKYLWDDVFKFNKYALFKSSLNSLDKVLREFKNQQGFSRFDIFNDDIQIKLKQGLQPSLSQVSENSDE